jgi:ABC-type polysaccharide/polyol phosphate transport system ATPase subunit
MITLENVSKIFKIPTDRRLTLRDRVVNIFNKNDYKELIVLKDINLEVKQGEFIGIIGKNGSGKSTLLYLISEIYLPTKGKVSVNGSIMPFLELGIGFNDELSATDNIYTYGALLGLPKKQISKKFDNIIKFAELEKFVNVKLKNFSSGMRVRLAFATAIQMDADIYLVDEVLAVGDLEFQKKCFDVFKKFKKDGKTIIYVSHNLSTIKDFCDRCIYLDAGQIKANGKPENVIAEYLKC